MRQEGVHFVLTFSTVIFHAKLSMALLNFLPFKPSFVPRLCSSSWNSIPKNTDCHITQCTIDFPYKNVERAFSVLQLGLPTTSFCAFPTSFSFMTPSWENIFQNKGAMCSFGAVLPLGLWLSLPVLRFHTGTSPCRHSSSTSACSLHCCQYCDKRQSPVALLELMTFHLGRLAGTCGRYLFSTANAGSNAHLLINLHQPYRKALVLQNDKLHQKHISLITALPLLLYRELRHPTTALLHFISSFCGNCLQICCWIQKFRGSRSRLKILRYPINPPISEDLHSVCNHFFESGVDWETKWKRAACGPLYLTKAKLALNNSKASEAYPGWTNQALSPALS